MLQAVRDHLKRLPTGSIAFAQCPATSYHSKPTACRTVVRLLLSFSCRPNSDGTPFCIGTH
eukprot:15461885-Alexandrium_andersonii.AAC.1